MTVIKKVIRMTNSIKSVVSDYKLRHIDKLNNILYMDYEYDVEPMEIRDKECTPFTVRRLANDKYIIVVTTNSGYINSGYIILRPHALTDNIPPYKTRVVDWRIRSGKLKVKPLAIVASIVTCGTPTCLAEKMAKLVYESTVDLSKYLIDVLSKLVVETINVDPTAARLG